MHSLDELKRQYQAASDRAKQAALDLKQAAERLQIGILEDSGLLGHIVEGPEVPGWKAEKKIVVEAVASARFGTLLFDSFTGSLLKKDGTKSLRTGNVVIATARDLGMFDA